MLAGLEARPRKPRRRGRQVRLLCLASLLIAEEQNMNDNPTLRVRQVQGSCSLSNDCTFYRVEYVQTFEGGSEIIRPLGAYHLETDAISAMEHLRQNWASVSTWLDLEEPCGTLN
jgi:hypothetical protein